jgi:hypothetical protein
MISPFVFLGFLLFSSEVFFDEPLCVFLGLPHFPSEVFVISPFVFLGLLLFLSEVFLMSQ